MGHDEQVTVAAVAHPTVLRQAAQAVIAKGSRSGPDGVSVQTFARDLEPNLARLGEALRSKAYAPGPSAVFYAEDDDGELRALTNANVVDKVAFTAVRLVLEEKLGASVSRLAFGGVRGRGPRLAVQALAAARDAGFGWALAGDVRACYPSIRHESVLERVAEAGEDAAWLVGLELRKPVLERGATRVPQRGLLQGGMLSALACNLVLSDVDRAAESLGGDGARYVDDFVYAYPSAASAGAAYERVLEALGHLGLELNADAASGLKRFDDGLDFLGLRIGARSIRIGPRWIERFKSRATRALAHLEPHRESAVLRELAQAVEGGRNYYSLGDCKRDLEALDAWMAESFPHLADRLPHFVAPARERIPRLNPYGPRRGVALPRASERRAESAFAPGPTTPAGTATLHRDADGWPVSALRDGAFVPVAALGPLAVPGALEAELQRAGAFNRATVAAGWLARAADATAPALETAVLASGAAMAGRSSLDEARDAFSRAVLVFAGERNPFVDARPTWGVVRQLARLEAWSALLDTGLDLGPDAPPSGPRARPTIPRLAALLADALEAPLAGHALVRAVSRGEAQRPQVAFSHNLEFTISYRGRRVPWREVVRGEALLIAYAVRARGPYRAWLWSAARGV